MRPRRPRSGKRFAPIFTPSGPRLLSPSPCFGLWLAAAAALLLLAIAEWRASPLLRTDDYQAELAEEIVDAHVHSLQPGHLPGISSNDEQAVKGWFKGKLTHTLPVNDFANNGFALLGGRRDVVGNGTPLRAQGPGKAINGLLGERAK